ncbi:hypothetical protein LAZ67_X002279 [Cordylochernes scorpioides]|uniref:Uncharacterized protein n=1 Tax=Cordylochernes scorpioides TaxID=51811 RepID=A0ABY6LUB2_9ARAC|nr:hypothetical protein LAZ67_X002279 [Cordylochernes scorpioides]
MYPSCYLTLTQKYSSAYLIRVIAILLIIGGVELNPGPPTSKQICRLYKLLRQTKLTVIETSQKTCLELATKNDLRIKSLKDHGDMLDRKIRENNLIFYSIKGPKAKNSDETLCKLVKVINEMMQIQVESEITCYHQLSRKANAPILVEIPKQITRIATPPLSVPSLDEKGGGGAVTSSLKNLGSAPADSTLLELLIQTQEQHCILISKKRELSVKGIRSKLRDNKLLANGQKYEVVDGRVVGEKGSTS